MNQTNESTPVTEFILSSEKNLRIAQAVHAGWDPAKDTIAKDFCRRLEAELKKNLPEWELSNDGLLASRRGAFAIWKPGWDGYCILLQPEDYGAEMNYGIMRDEKLIAERPFSTELLEAIKEHVPSARAKTWWEALIKLQSPASDWTTPEILWQMKTNETFLQEVASQLLELAQLSEKLVDSLVAQYRGKEKK